MRTIEEAVSEVSRELSVRRRCYARWIEDGKLSKVDANDRLERLEAAEHYLLAHAEHMERIRMLNEAPEPVKKPLDTAVHS
jgi:hypothetical protein